MVVMKRARMSFFAQEIIHGFAEKRRYGAYESGGFRAGARGRMKRIRSQKRKDFPFRMGPGTICGIIQLFKKTIRRMTGEEIDERMPA